MPDRSKGDNFRGIFGRKVGTPPWAVFSDRLAVDQPRYPKAGWQDDGAAP